MTNYIYKVQLKCIEVDLANSSTEGCDCGCGFLFVSGQAVQNYVELQNTHIYRHILGCQPAYSIRAGFAKLFLCSIGF